MLQRSKQSGPRKTALHQDQSITTIARTGEKELEHVKKIIEQATDIRQERVEAAKLSLKEGKLKLKGNDLAEKILADPLNQMRIMNSFQGRNTSWQTPRWAKSPSSTAARRNSSRPCHWRRIF
jgi:anti-sigma28 factor (negative regulator of flagellin synthesis)